MEYLPLEHPTTLWMAFLACVPDHPSLSLGPLPSCSLWPLPGRKTEELWGHPSKPASFALTLWCGTSAAQYPEASCWKFEDPKYLKSSLLVLMRGLF